MFCSPQSQAPVTCRAPVAGLAGLLLGSQGAVTHPFSPISLGPSCHLALSCPLASLFLSTSCLISDPSLASVPQWTSFIHSTEVWPLKLQGPVGSDMESCYLRDHQRQPQCQGSALPSPLLG